jgi:hypothetical protein
MLNKFILAVCILCAGTFTVPQLANAHGSHTGIQIVIGIPGHHVHITRPVTISQARLRLRRFGYANVRYQRTGSRGYYRFTAVRTGKKYLIRVNPRNGNVVSRRRIR